MPARPWAPVALAAYVASVWGANWFISHVGDPLGDGVHLLPVGFGGVAPSGFVMVGASLTLRDIVQRLLGIRAVIVAICVGALLPMFLNPRIAVASGATFLMAEFLDLLVYTRVARRNILAAVIASNTVGSVVDSLVFLTLAFGLTAAEKFWFFNTLGKIESSLLFLPIVFAIRRTAEVTLLATTSTRP